MKATLSDVCNIIAGYAFKGKDFNGDGYPVIKITDIQPPYASTISCSHVNLSSYDTSKLTKYLVSRNDFVIAMTGATIGKIGRITSGLAYMNQRVAKFEINDSTTKAFVYQLLLSDSFTTHINSNIDSQSAQPNISAGSIGRFEFDLPTKDQQRHIVDILGSIDEKIEKLEKENKEFQKLCLSQFKLYFNNKEKVALNKLATVTMGQSPDGNTINESSGTIFYQGRTDFGFRYPEVRLFTSAPKRMAKEDDILLSVRAPVGDVNVAMENCCIGRGLAAISSNYKHFVFYSLLAQQSDFDVYNNTGTIFGSINREALLSFGVPASDMIDVVKFDSLAAIIDSKIKQNVIESIKLKELKALHLQKFFG